MEQSERIRQIRERLASYEAYYPSDSDLWPTALKNSIEDNKYLLSLLDSQAAEGITVSTLVGYEAGRKDGGEEMRDACVAKVKEVATKTGILRFGKLSANADVIVTALSSLTLDQGEQEKQK